MLNSTCNKCKLEKPLSEFYYRDKSKQIPTTYCKECNKLRVKNWRKTKVGKEKWKQYTKDKIVRVRTWLNEQRALGCERCEEMRFYVIDFHHKDPAEKKFTLGSGYANSNFKATKEEVSKCIRLCANCHRELHYLENNSNLQ
jgi:hypothetical protein